MFIGSIEGIALAREQREQSGLTPEENTWLNQQQDFLAMGIRLAPTETDLAVAESIRRKMNRYRYGHE